LGELDEVAGGDLALGRDLEMALDPDADVRLGEQGSNTCNAQLKEWRAALPAYQQYRRAVAAYDQLSAEPGEASSGGGIEGLVAMTKGVKHLTGEWRKSRLAKVFKKASVLCAAQMPPVAAQIFAEPGKHVPKHGLMNDTAHFGAHCNRSKESLQKQLLPLTDYASARIAVLVELQKANEEIARQQSATWEGAKGIEETRGLRVKARAEAKQIASEIGSLELPLSGAVLSSKDRDVNLQLLGYMRQQLAWAQDKVQQATGQAGIIEQRNLATRDALAAARMKHRTLSAMVASIESQAMALRSQIRSFRAKIKAKSGASTGIKEIKIKKRKEEGKPSGDKNRYEAEYRVAQLQALWKRAAANVLRANKNVSREAEAAIAKLKASQAVAGRAAARTQALQRRASSLEHHFSMAVVPSERKGILTQLVALRAKLQQAQDAQLLAMEEQSVLLRLSRPPSTMPRRAQGNAGPKHARQLEASYSGLMDNIHEGSRLMADYAPVVEEVSKSLYRSVDEARSCSPNKVFVRITASINRGEATIEASLDALQKAIASEANRNTAGNSAVHNAATGEAAAVATVLSASSTLASLPKGASKSWKLSLEKSLQESREAAKRERKARHESETSLRKQTLQGLVQARCGLAREAREACCKDVVQSWSWMQPGYANLLNAESAAVPSYGDAGRPIHNTLTKLAKNLKAVWGTSPSAEAQAAILTACAKDSAGFTGPSVEEQEAAANRDTFAAELAELNKAKQLALDAYSKAREEEAKGKKAPKATKSLLEMEVRLRKEGHMKARDRCNAAKAKLTAATEFLTVTQAATARIREMSQVEAALKKAAKETTDAARKAKAAAELKKIQATIKILRAGRTLAAAGKRPAKKNASSKKPKRLGEAKSDAERLNAAATAAAKVAGEKKDAAMAKRAGNALFTTKEAIKTDKAEAIARRPPTGKGPCQAGLAHQLWSTCHSLSREAVAGCKGLNREGLTQCCEARVGEWKWGRGAYQAYQTQYLSMAKRQKQAIRNAWLESPDAKMAAYATTACKGQDFALTAGEFAAHEDATMHRDASPPYQDVQEEKKKLESAGDTVARVARGTTMALASSLKAIHDASVDRHLAKTVGGKMAKIEAYLASGGFKAVVAPPAAAARKAADDRDVKRKSVKNAMDATRSLAKRLKKMKSDPEKKPKAELTAETSAQLHAAYAALLMERHRWGSAAHQQESDATAAGSSAKDALTRLTVYKAHLIKYATAASVRERAAKLMAAVLGAIKQVKEADGRSMRETSLSRSTQTEEGKQFKTTKGMVAAANKPGPSLSKARANMIKKEKALRKVVTGLKKAAKGVPAKKP